MFDRLANGLIVWALHTEQFDADIIRFVCSMDRAFHTHLAYNGICYTRIFVIERQTNIAEQIIPCTHTPIPSKAMHRQTMAIDFVTVSFIPAIHLGNLQ